MILTFTVLIIMILGFALLCLIGEFLNMTPFQVLVLIIIFTLAMVLIRVLWWLENYVLLFIAYLFGWRS